MGQPIDNATFLRHAELAYLKQFSREDCCDNELFSEQLRSLWTAHCLHHRLMVDTSEYDSALFDLWLTIEEGLGTTVWSDFDSFDGYMCRNLV